MDVVNSMLFCLLKQKMVSHKTTSAHLTMFLNFLALVELAPRKPYITASSKSYTILFAAALIIVNFKGLNKSL